MQVLNFQRQGPPAHDSTGPREADLRRCYGCILSAQRSLSEADVGVQIEYHRFCIVC